MFKSLVNSIMKLDESIRHLAEKISKETGRKIYYIDVGNMTPSEAEKYIKQTLQKMKVA